jgi:hypothetical protein
LEENLIKWINNISEKRNELGSFSICPFAKKALEEKKVYVSYIDETPMMYILKYIENLSVSDFELIIFYNLSKSLTDDDLKYIISMLHKEVPHLVFLKDHPNNPGYINGVHTGNGEYPLILVQPKNKLEEARNKLKKTKYYDVWSDEYKNEIWSYGNEC